MLLPPKPPIINETENLATTVKPTDEQYLEFWRITHDNWCARADYARAQIDYFTAKINERKG